MTLVDELQALLSSFKPKPDRAEELRRLEEFYERMKAEGFATTREYDLPPLDTIGRALRSAAFKPSNNAMQRTRNS